MIDSVAHFESDFDGQTRGPAGEAEIQEWLISQVADVSGADPSDVDINQPFTYYGLSSAEAVMIAGDLEHWLNRSLPATLLWDCPTISLLAGSLVQGAGSSSFDSSSSDLQFANNALERLLREIECPASAEAALNGPSGEGRN